MAALQGAPSKLNSFKVSVQGLRPSRGHLGWVLPAPLCLCSFARLAYQGWDKNGAVSAAGIITGRRFSKLGPKGHLFMLEEKWCSDWTCCPSTPSIGWKNERAAGCTWDDCLDKHQHWGDRRVCWGPRRVRIWDGEKCAAHCWFKARHGRKIGYENVHHTSSDWLD